MSTGLAVFALLTIAILGAAVGSFLNVVIARVPEGRSVVHPPSACPSCASPIAPYDNIPVISWVILRGRCRQCAEPISVRYPMVETGTGAAWVVVAIAGWTLGAAWAIPVGLALVSVAVVWLGSALDRRAAQTVRPGQNAPILRRGVRLG